MTTGIWILGDQLWADQAALKSCAHQKSQTPVILIESAQYVRQRPYHRQKLVLVWSAMRHFAEELRQAGWPVTYRTAEDFAPPLEKWLQTEGITELRVMTPSDRPFLKFIRSLDLPCALTLLPNNHFLWSEADFSEWAAGRKSLLMESFYREGRKRFQILMEGDQPVGGQWNFDKQNRKPPKGEMKPPAAHWFTPDAVTEEVIQWVQSQNFSTYGQVQPFRWGVTRQNALDVLEYFVRDRLPTFGPYQDAMVAGEETMWHAMLSPYLNLGLLHPLEVVQAAEAAFYDQSIPLNSIEGFIRQILGWREYMHGVYVHADNTYPDQNWFDHTQPVPDFFWDASQTDMNCLHQVLSQVERMGYVHHIQRLMILSNFALIAGLSPQAVEDWFHSVFVDAYDWVMQPNVIGMGLFADGGHLASKPYASSANYINRMSNYCKGCRYKQAKRTGEDACPFNFFYWDFLDRHRDKLKSQGRMNFILANLDKMAAEERQEIKQHAQHWLDNN
ncbi:MAG: cryptochrome/photolyase family protein [Elainellaceae cyanobacterium]